MTNKAKQLAVRMETYAKFPYLIEITHPTYGVYRYANSDENITYNGDTYLAGCFSITPPERKENSIGDAKLSISAIDQEWIYNIRNTDERAKIKFLATIVYDDAMHVEQVEPLEELEFTLTKATWDTKFAISWNMTFDEGMGLCVPCDKATANKVPASK